jgi:hypothetical protein
MGALALMLTGTGSVVGAQRGVSAAGAGPARRAPSLEARIAALKCGVVKPLLSRPAQRTIASKMASAMTPFGIDLPDVEVELTVCPERANADGARLAARLSAVAPGDTATRRRLIQDAAGYIRSARSAADTFPSASFAELPPSGGPFVAVEPAAVSVHPPRGVSAQPPPAVAELLALSRQLARSGDQSRADEAFQSAAAVYTRWADGRVRELLAEMDQSSAAGVVDVDRAKEIIKIRKERGLFEPPNAEIDPAIVYVSARLMRGLNIKAAGFACLPSFAQAKELVEIVKSVQLLEGMADVTGAGAELFGKHRNVRDALYAYFWEEGSSSPARELQARGALEMFFGAEYGRADIFESANDPCPWEGTATISIVVRGDTTIPGPRGNTTGRLLDSLTWDVTVRRGIANAVARGRFEDVTTLVVANQCFGRPPQPSMSLRDETRNEGAPTGQGAVKLRKVVVQRAPDRARATLGDSLHLQLTLPTAVIQTTYTKKTEITGGCPSTTVSPPESLTQDRASWTAIVGGRLQPLDPDSPGRLSGRSTLTPPGSLGTVTMVWDLHRGRTSRPARPSGQEEE